MRFTQLNDWLSWLEQAHPSEIDLGLERVGQVLARMQRPSRARVITVAGTNGKGSCVAVASALLQAAGLRVGSYTSPHIHHYCERVRINADKVSEADMCRAFAAVDRARQATSLTYFEFGTLAALALFAEHNVDVMVLEVGLGGRLDAVNVIDPDVAVITSIGIDHVAWLGSDRDSIGREKAGIMRTGKPVICTEPKPPASLLQHAAAIGAPLQLLGRDFTLELSGSDTTQQRWRLCSQRDQSSIDLPATSLVIDSVAAAIEAVKALGVELAELDLTPVLSTLALPGRMQWLTLGATPALLDVAHNPAATGYLAQALQRRATSGRVVAVVAMMADKDIAGTLQPLLGVVDEWWAVGLPDVPRAASAQTLAATIAKRGGTARTCANLDAALKQLTQPAYSLGADDVLVLFGSFFTVAAALEAWPAYGQLLATAEGEVLSE
jgi:dihydrofolate synthase/folylpolyglutamate synthase